MTEKRFSVKKSESGLFYRDGDYEIDNTIQFIIETVEMKLNYLSDENEQLKKQIKDLYKFVKYDVDNEIDVYPESILEHLVTILKIIGDV